MEKTNIINYYSKIIDEKKITQSLTKKKLIQINGLIGSIKSIIFSASFLKFNKTFIYISSNKDDAISFINDIRELIPKENVFFFQKILVKISMTKIIQLTCQREVKFLVN